MKTIALYGLQMLVGLVALAAGYAKLTGMGFMAEPFAMIGLGKTFLMIAGTVEILAGPLPAVPALGRGRRAAAGDRDGRHDGREPRPRDQPARHRPDRRLADLPHRRAGRRDGPPAIVIKKSQGWDI